MKERFKYDIFISYKHEELDKAVASKLQKKLEHYRIPKEIKQKTGKKKIERVFRDEEELSISSDLGRVIEEQIRQTEYLLLVCSKKTKHSAWVLREIETFLKYQDIDHILPVLIEGEPEEVFPEILLSYGEPLAVDLRDKNKKRILKKVDKELPRILAPVLHCSYDELKQRHKVYRTYRLLGIVGIGLGISVIFATYAFVQSQKLKREYEQTRKNQARYLCNVSENLLESGDRMGALRTAIGIFPEDSKDNKPVVPEQLNALNNALYSYKDNSEVCFRAERMQKLKGIVYDGVKFSKEGSYCVTVDNNGYVYFFDGKTGKTIWKNINISTDKEAIYAAEPLDEEKAVLVTKTKIVIVDIKDKKVTFKKKYKSDSEKKNVLVLKDKAVLWNEQEIITIGLKKEKQGQENIVQLSNIRKVIVDKSQKQLFIAIGGQQNFDAEGNLIYDEKEKVGEAGIYKYTFKEKKLKRISKRATEKICLINENQIAAVQYTKYVSKDLYNSKITYCLSVYDINSGKILWQQKKLKGFEDNEQTECKFFSMNVKDKENKKILIFYFKKTIYCVDIDKYKLVDKKTYESDITGIEQFDNSRLLIGLSTGSIYLYKGYDRNWKMDHYANWANNLRKVGGIKSDFLEGCFLYNRQKQTAIQYSLSKEIVFLRNIGDKKARILDDSQRVDTVSYFKVKKGRRNVIYRSMNNVYDDREEIVIYESGTSKSIYTIKLKKDEYIDNEIIGLRNKRVTLCYTLHGKNNNLEFCMVNLEKKKKINNYKLSKIDYIESMIYSRDLNCIYVAASDGRMWIIEFEKNKIKIIEEEEWEWRDKVQIIKKTENERYLIFLFRNNDNVNKYYLKIWDRKRKNWLKIEGEEKIRDVGGKNGFSVGKKNNIIAVSKKNGQIQVIDIDRGRIQKKVNLLRKKETEKTIAYNDYDDMQFFANDKYILKLNENEDKLRVIDVRKGILTDEINTTESMPKIIVEDNSQYFAIKGGINGRNRNEIDKQNLIVYMIDNETKRIIQYAVIPYGWISFDGNEIIGGIYVTYYTKIYSFLQLRKEAEQLLKGEKLTKAERIEYSLE